MAFHCLNMRLSRHSKSEILCIWYALTLWFVFIADALHITPVKGIIQLRPGFSYFDKAEENQKKAAAALIEAEKGLRNCVSVSAVD